jgi:hypothetical protein
MAKGTFTIELDPSSVKGLTALANNVAIYPNRINRARNRATNRAVKRIRRTLESNYGYSIVKYIDIISVNGSNKSTIKLKIPRAQSTSGEKQSARNAALWVLNIKLNGRRAYRSKKKGTSPYVLREGSQGKYPKVLWSWRVPAKSYSYEFRRTIKTTPLAILNRMFVEELRKEGFGPRGGAPGIRQDSAPSVASSPKQFRGPSR